MRRGGSLLPRATPSSRPMPSASICRSSRISTEAPPAAAIAAARVANSRGVSVLPGSLASSRARLLHSPRSRPRPTAASMRGWLSGDVSSSGGTTIVRLRRRRRLIAGLVDARAELGEREALGDRLREAGEIDVAGRIRQAGPQQEPEPRDAPLPRRERAAVATRRAAAAVKTATRPAPTNRTRRGFHVPSMTFATNRSNGRAANSFVVSARASSPPTARSRPATAEGESSSNHGTTSKVDVDRRERRGRMRDRL